MCGYEIWADFEFSMCGYEILGEKIENLRICLDFNMLVIKQDILFIEIRCPRFVPKEPLKIMAKTIRKFDPD